MNKNGETYLPSNIRFDDVGRRKSDLLVSVDLLDVMVEIRAF